MFKVFGVLTRKQDMERRDFIDHYEDNHVPLICGLALSPIVYKRNDLVRGDEINRDGDEIDFDVVTELVFPDGDAYLAWSAAVGTGEAGEQVSTDEARLLDRARTRAYVIEEHATSG
jgi:hypothetical protein